MTDDERREAERLANNFTPRNDDAIDANYLRQCIINIYEIGLKAGREPMRAEMEHLKFWIKHHRWVPLESENGGHANIKRKTK